MTRGSWVLLACALACAPVTVLPLALRPDTRQFVALRADSVALAELGVIFTAALPREASACLDGRVAGDTIFLTGARAARADSADVYHVYLPMFPVSGCASPTLIALAHSHVTMFPGVPCTHSDDDARVLFRDVRAALSIVLCIDGQGELLWQDGRRSPFSWRD